jgi:uncharacterized protein (DUF1778 family)
MPTKTKSSSRLSIRLQGELKDVIEAAASQLGQSLSDYAVSTLVQNARQVLQQQSLTILSERDRDLFVALLDDADARPNRALQAAARRHKKHFG